MIIANIAIARLVVGLVRHGAWRIAVGFAIPRGCESAKTLAAANEAEQPDGQIACLFHTDLL
jgi:hypothetical protein